VPAQPFPQRAAQPVDRRLPVAVHGQLPSLRDPGVEHQDVDLVVAQAQRVPHRVGLDGHVCVAGGGEPAPQSGDGVADRLRRGRRRIFVQTASISRTSGTWRFAFSSNVARTRCSRPSPSGTTSPRDTRVSGPSRLNATVAAD
jgi:hypothetical protein